MSEGGAAGSVMRAVVSREILLVTLAILLASLLSFVVAMYIYYPWPEKLMIHSSLIAFSFFIAVRRPGRQFHILLRLPRGTVTLALVAGLAALIAASIIPSPWLALLLALVYAALVAGVSLAEVLKLRGVFDDVLGFALFSFIIGSTYFVAAGYEDWYISLFTRLLGYKVILNPSCIVYHDSLTRRKHNHYIVHNALHLFIELNAPAAARALHPCKSPSSDQRKKIH